MPDDWDEWVRSRGQGEPPTSREDWPEPQPFEDGHRLPFPVDVLPPLMAAAVQEVVDAVQVDPCLPATAALGALAGAVGSRTTVVVEEGWQSRCNLYLAVVAGTGEAKTPSFRPFQGPLVDLQTARMKEAARAKAHAKVSLDALLRAEMALAGQAVHTPEDMVALVELTEQIDNAKRALRFADLTQVLVDDVTPERLAILMEANHGEMIAWSDEGVPLLHMLGMYAKSPNLDVFLKSWDGNPVTVDRKGGNGSGATRITISEPCLTHVLAVQPTTIRRFGEKDHRPVVDRGAVARLLVSWPPSRLGTRVLADRPEVVYRALPAWNAELLRLVGEDRRVLALDAVARKAFLHWRDAREAEVPIGRLLSDVKEFLPKITGAVPRLAAQWARAEGWPTVTEEHVARAVRLGDFYLAHSRAVVVAWGSSSDLAERFVAKAHEIKVEQCTGCPTGPGWGRLSVVHVRDVHRLVRHSDTKVAEVIDALELLHDLGWVRPLDPDVRYGTGNGKAVGRQSPHVILNPRWRPLC